MDKPKFGTIGWIDLTVPDAKGIKNFYSEVVGWKPEPVSMGEYDDFNMIAEATGEPQAGICHTLGTNKDIPPAWMIYITVENLDESLAAVNKYGGEQVTPIKEMPTYGKYCFIKDPAGAVCALFEPV